MTMFICFAHIKKLFRKKYKNQLMMAIYDESGDSKKIHVKYILLGFELL